MKDAKKQDRSIKTLSWTRPLVIFIVLQLILILIDISPWTPNLRDLDGRILGRLLKSKLFTEWFTPYSVPEFNLYTVVFAVTLLPVALLNAIKAIFSRRETSS